MKDKGKSEDDLIQAMEESKKVMEDIDFRSLIRNMAKSFGADPNHEDFENLIRELEGRHQ